MNDALPILHPNLLEGADPADPSAAIINLNFGRLRGIMTIQAADDETLRALLDVLAQQVDEDPVGLREMLLVGRSSLSTNH